MNQLDKNNIVYNSVVWIAFLASTPVITAAIILWFPFQQLLRLIIRRMPKQCSIHKTQLVWGFPYPINAFLTDEELDMHCLRRVLRVLYDVEKIKNFPNIESNRDSDSLLALFSIYHTHDPWSFCPHCIDQERKWLLTKRSNEKLRYIVMDKKGWAVCPWCSVRFKYYSSSCKNNRHIRCGQKIKLSIQQ